MITMAMWWAIGMNELLFVASILFISSSALVALRLGREVLIALVCVQWILANLLVTQQITLLGLNATSSDALAVGAMLCLNLIQEYFGKALARKTIFIGFGTTLFYAIITLVHVTYTPSPFDTMHSCFYMILAPMPRLLAASMITYLVVELCNYKLYALLSSQKVPLSFTLRNYIATGTSQLLDTVLFSFLGLYGRVDSLWSIILVSYTIKLAVIMLATPFISLSRYITIDRL